MSDKQPMQASGGDGHEGAPDGVEDPNGNRGGGQSDGGAYPNPNGPDNKKNSGFFGHGGQSHIDYSGPGDKDDPRDNRNAATGAD